MTIVKVNSRHEWVKPIHQQFFLKPLSENDNTKIQLAQNRPLQLTLENHITLLTQVKKNLCINLWSPRIRKKMITCYFDDHLKMIMVPNFSRVHHYLYMHIQIQHQPSQLCFFGHPLKMY